MNLTKDEIRLLIKRWIAEQANSDEAHKLIDVLYYLINSNDRV